MNRSEMFVRQFGAVALEVGGTVAGYVVGMKYRHPYIGGFVGFIVGGGLGWWVARPVVEATQQELSEAAAARSGAPVGAFQFIPPAPVRVAARR